MVVSKINADVQYEEKSRYIDPEDKGHESSLYEVELFGKPVVIAIGKPKYTFTRFKLVFYPIYIVSNNNAIEGQIGVFEIEQDKILGLFDEEGDVDITKFYGPLLYDFAERLITRTKSDPIKYLMQSNGKAEEKEVEKEEKEEKEEKKDESDEVMELKVPGSKEIEKAEKILEPGVFDTDEKAEQIPLLAQETEEDANKLKKDYKETTRTSWIQKFMKNNEYRIHDVENNGDCFFAVIRDAFKQIGQITTVAKLRALLANEITDEIFQEHRALYNSLDGNIRECENEMAKIKKILEVDMKKRAKAAQDDKTELDAILKENDRLKEKFRELRAERSETEKIRDQSFGNLRDIDTIEKFRRYVQTPNYWADSGSITIMERLLQIKMIIFSELSYEGKAFDSVLECGEIDSKIQADNSFNPNFYIMTSYSGNHYRLVSYKNKRIFKYRELPYHTKILIVNKCLEKNAGIYYLIQDFRNFKSSLGIEPDVGAPSSGDDDDLHGDLYNPDTVFMFHAKSEKTAKPGRGSGEKVPMAKRDEFIALGRIPDWRRKLDDSWELSPFSLDGHRWASVEHYYQASKFKKGFPDFYLQFSLDSETEISKDIALAKLAGSKSGKEKGKVLRPSNITIDPEFYPERNLKEREFAVQTKFAQNEDLKQLLKATKTAKLIHFVRGSEPTVDMTLMKIRNQLS